MSKIRYKIVEIKDLEGNHKKDELGLMQYEYSIQHISEGTRAILLTDEITGEHVSTSPIQSFRIWQNGIHLETKNTVYSLEPIIKGE